MRIPKLIKTIFGIVTLASLILLSTQFSSSILSIKYAADGVGLIKITFANSIQSTYGSYWFLLFIFGLSFPLIAAFIDNKTACLTLSSLSFAFYLPYVFKLIQYYEDIYKSLNYNGMRVSKCSLYDNFIIILVGVALLMVSSLAIFVCSFFDKRKVKE